MMRLNKIIEDEYRYEEKKFFLYANTLEEIAKCCPKLKSLMMTIKQGFHEAIRRIVFHEKEKVPQI
jgi:hypothetical protein